MNDRHPMAEQLVFAHVTRPEIPSVYLDLNHFIYLARAKTDAKAALPGYTALHTALVQAVQERRIVVPLSGEHFFEMTRIKDPRQRRDITDIMEELSNYQYLLGRPTIARLEIEAGVEHLLGESPFLQPILLIGDGVFRAFGRDGGIKIVDADGNDVSAAAREAMGEDQFEEFLRNAHHTTQRELLSGPSDADAVDLRANYGYRPEVAWESHQSRLEFETALNLDEKWRRGRLRDVISAREITHEWYDKALPEVKTYRTIRGQQRIEFTAEQIVQVASAMPHHQVAISMKTRYHRNPNHRWTTNDIADIDALSVAYAYCDVVFTDKAARAALASAKELRVFDTYLPKTPNELTERLNTLSPLPTTC